VSGPAALPRKTAHDASASAVRIGSCAGRAAPTSPRPTSSSPACCSWRTTSRPCCRPAGPPRSVRRHGRLHVRRRDHAPDADGQVRHGRAPERADGAAQALRGNASAAKTARGRSSGASQMAMLRRIPKLLRFIPGTAQDVRAYFLLLQYWLAGSDENIANMVRILVDRYADGPRAALRGKLKAEGPAEYPEVGVFHPRMKGRITDKVTRLPPRRPRHRRPAGDALLRAGRQHRPLRRRHQGAGGRGLRVIPAFASGLDARPAVEQFFLKNGKPGGRCRGLADRLLAGGRPGLQRRRRGAGGAGGAGCALHRRPSGGVPDPGAVAGLRARPDAGGGDHDGRHPRARRLHRADGVRRALRGGQRTAAATCSPIRSGPDPGRPRRSADQAAQDADGRAQGRASCCSTSRPMPATPAPRPIWVSSRPCSIR
jgi:hypothetical protein